MSVFKMLFFLWSLNILEGLERSGRLAGTNHANFVEIRLDGAEVWAKSERVNDKKATTISI